MPGKVSINEVGVSAENMSDNTLISVVVPCYNEEEGLPLFISELQNTLHFMQLKWPDLKFEVILVDDGSTDDTLSVMKGSVRDASLTGLDEAAIDGAEVKDIEIRFLSLSKNFGKEAALFAGLENARGDYVATMDADMQDPPSLLPKMYEILIDSEGAYDNVATRRVTRSGEPRIRSLFARCFYRIINRISDADIVDGARDYRLMRRSMVNAIVSLRERNRFSKGIFGWVGFKTKWLEFENIERAAGETKWSLFGLFRYSIEGMVAFSSAPLALSSIAGIILSLVAVISILIVFVRTLLFGDPVAGWPSLICIILLVGGLQLLSLGILGSYMSRTYIETKERPLYIVREEGSSEQFHEPPHQEKQAREL